MKKCTKCGESRPPTEFSKQASSQDGMAWRCKACSKIYDSKYHADNREKHNARCVKWHADNRDKSRSASAKYYAANKDMAKAYNTKYRADNPDKRKPGDAKWKAANHESLRIYDQNRKARMRGSGGNLSKGLASKLIKLQKGKCTCGCGQLLRYDYHLDHIMPLALGGDNTDKNIQLLRSRCNLQKSAKHPVDFMRQKGFLI